MRTQLGLKCIIFLLLMLIWQTLLTGCARFDADKYYNETLPSITVQLTKNTWQTKCIDGVQYIVADSWASVKFNRDGKPETCYF